MVTITINVKGAEEVKAFLRKTNKAVQGISEQIHKPMNELLNMWKQNMPVSSGFMKRTASGVVETKGEARVFTRTFQSAGGSLGMGRSKTRKSGGYAIFPEIGQPKIHPIFKVPIHYTRIGFTKKTADQFEKKWGADVINKIDKAIGAR